MGRLLILFLLVTSAFGEVIYISQAGSGGGTGADTSNRASAAFFNNAANWASGAGKISPGDTVSISGTFTTALQFQGSGTAGNVITLLFEPGANFTTTVWPDTGAIRLNGQSYLVVDGGATDNLGGRNGNVANAVGYIRNTDNGTSLANQTDSIGLAGVAHHTTVQNLKITDIYKNNPAITDTTRFGYGIYMQGDDNTIQNCYIADGDGCISYTGPAPGDSYPTTNTRILNNTLLRANHAINGGWGNASAGPQNVTWDGLTIAGNYFDDSADWDNSDMGGGNYSHHIDAIIIFCSTYDPTVVMNNLRIYNNLFGSNFGVHNTGAIFINLYRHEQLANSYVFNNLFLNTTRSWGNGYLVTGGTNLYVFNNSMISTDPAQGGMINSGGANCFIYNNLMKCSASMTLTTDTGDTGLSGAQNPTNNAALLNAYFTTNWSNWNCFPYQGDFQWQLKTNSSNSTIWLSGIFHTVTGWNNWNGGGGPDATFNATHSDPSSNTRTPVFNAGTYVPAAGDTAARGQGTNLTSVFTAMGLAAADYYGNPRPASGPWTIGAFEGPPPSAGGPGGRSVGPPTRLRAIFP